MKLSQQQNQNQYQNQWIELVQIYQGNGMTIIKINMMISMKNKNKDKRMSFMRILETIKMMMMKMMEMMENTKKGTNLEMKAMIDRTISVSTIILQSISSFFVILYLLLWNIDLKYGIWNMEYGIKILIYCYYFFIIKNKNRRAVNKSVKLILIFRNIFYSKWYYFKINVNINNDVRWHHNYLIYVTISIPES